MDIGRLAPALDEMRDAMKGDGVGLHLTKVDAHSQLVEVELDLSGADCAECVLPPDVVSAMVHAGLKQRVPGNYRIELVDPRRQGPAADNPNDASPRDRQQGSPLMIVDPAAESAAGDLDPGPDA